MSKRKPLSKRTRFEVFKRDAFRCIYCGATAIQRPLHVDHVVALANGGTDEPANLVTACADCNLGKNAVPLERKRFGPVELTEDLEDRAEIIRAYLAQQREIEQAKRDVCDAFLSYWEECIGGMSQKLYDRLPKLLAEWPIEKLHEAVDITARKMGYPGRQYDPGRAEEQQRYFQAILRNWRNGVVL